MKRSKIEKWINKTIQIIVIVVSLSSLICLTACNNSSKDSGLGIFGYIIGIGLIIGGAVALVADGKNHGALYVIGEIVMVILLITFG